jgi:hypothetical protein
VARGEVSVRHDAQTLADIIVGALTGGIVNWTVDKTYSIESGFHALAVALADLLVAETHVGLESGKVEAAKTSISTRLRALVGLAVTRRRHPDAATQVVAQVAARSETSQPGDLVDGQVTRFQ